jgi:hypothetical protein
LELDTSQKFEDDAKRSKLKKSSLQNEIKLNESQNKALVNTSVLLKDKLAYNNPSYNKQDM